MSVLTAPAPTLKSSPLSASSNHNMQAALLLAAIENFTVGLIIAASDGTILHQNRHAQTLLQEISEASSTVVPPCLWGACKSLIENQDIHGDLFPDPCHVTLEDELLTKQGTIHLRAQWFDWDNSSRQSTDCFLITLEDRQQSLTAMANQEAQRYGLTIREADVWRLKRMGHSYREISKALFISENTVKKHLKNVYAKREQFGVQDDT